MKVPNALRTNQKIQRQYMQHQIFDISAKVNELNLKNLEIDTSIETINKNINQVQTNLINSNKKFDSLKTSEEIY